jgi:hypothetical protein
MAVAMANGVGGSGAEWIPPVGLAAPWLALESWSAGHVSVLAVTLVAGAAGLWVSGNERPGTRLVMASWAGLPVLAVTLIGLVRPVFVDRYLLPALLALAAMVALGLSHLPRKVGAAALAGVVAVSVTATLAEAGRGPKDDIRGAVAAVARGHRPGEPVVAAARWDALGLDHYARHGHPSLVADLVLPPQSAPGVPSLWVVRRSRGGVKGDGPKRLALDLELRRRGMRVVLQERLRDRYGSVLVQRWDTGVATRGGFPARPVV